MRAAVLNDGLLLTVRVKLVSCKDGVTTRLCKEPYLYLVDGGHFESRLGDFF